MCYEYKTQMVLLQAKWQPEIYCTTFFGGGGGHQGKCWVGGTIWKGGWVGGCLSKFQRGFLGGGK